MTETSVSRDQEAKRYPLSFTQEWFLSMDKGDYNGPFGNRYLIVVVLRITGPVDLAVLQGALDDVVARHELLRTLVVRDADPPYQMVVPPCQVPLEVRNPPVTGKSRDKIIQELFVEAETGTISTREVPLMRALLARFDDRDSALFLTVHHSVSSRPRLTTQTDPSTISASTIISASWPGPARKLSWWSRSVSSRTTWKSGTTWTWKPPRPRRRSSRESSDKQRATPPSPGPPPVVAPRPRRGGGHLLPRQLFVADLASNDPGHLKVSRRVV